MVVGKNSSCKSKIWKKGGHRKEQQVKTGTGEDKNPGQSGKEYIFRDIIDGKIGHLSE